MSKIILTFLILISICIFSACGENADASPEVANTTPPVSVSTPNSNSQNSFQRNSQIPQTVPEPLATTNSPIGKFDFKNYTYPLPRGWQGAISEIILVNGKAPLSMEEEERKIGASYVKTKYGDVTGDGQDEAFVIIKIETGGSALPQVVYVFDWKNEEPELIWYFRTGDRADGGLRDLRAENGELIIEIYGQDRYIFGDVETMKIVGDEEQLCCPTFFTRNRYKLTGNRFVLQGKRQTYSIAEPNSPPIENMGDLANQKEKGKK